MFRHPVVHWFTDTRFALKFAVVGLAIAGPLLVVCGVLVATLHGRVQHLQASEAALVTADHIRTLALSIGRHRGLSATVLAGGESASGLLVAEQAFMLPQFDRVAALLAAGGLGSTTLPDAARLRQALTELTQMPRALEARQNFERHDAIVNALLAASARLGRGLALPEHNAIENDMVFVQLPLLMEELGRQRGWGTALLTLQQAEPQALQAYLLYAGASARRLELMRADPATLVRLDRLHGGLERPLQEVLEQAQGFWQRSVAAVQQLAPDDEAGRRHFADGTAVIDQMAAVNETLVAVRRMHTDKALAHAERARAGALAALGVVLLLLLWLYREFSRSTVLRLQALGRAARGLAGSDFDQPIVVEGRDEIAQLGQAMDEARLRLRQALAERARGLAAEQADEAKTEFLARWSHDLRTPLNAVLGFADLLERRPGPRLDEAQRADLEQIRQAGQHLLRLVNDVLDITRVDAGAIRQPLAAHRRRDAAADAVVPPPAGAAAGAKAMPPGRVAYVEDDPVNVLLVREMLSAVPGLVLSVYGTVAEATAAAEAGAGFDLWLVDKQLPDGDGVGLLAQLRVAARVHGLPPPRAVMLSADALPGSVAPALAAGFLDYWTKPVALQRLREGVALHLARARAEAAVPAGPAGPAGLATIAGSGEPPT